MAGRILSQLDRVYSEMSRVVAQRPVCRDQSTDRMWVVLGLRSEEIENGIEDMFVEACNATGRDEARAADLLARLRTIYTFVQGLALASRGYKQIEQFLTELEQTGLEKHADTVAFLVRILGIGQTHAYYQRFLSLLESTDQQKLLNSTAYAEEQLEAARESLRLGKAVERVGRAADAWLDAQRHIQEAVGSLDQRAPQDNAGG